MNNKHSLDLEIVFEGNGNVQNLEMDVQGMIMKHNTPDNPAALTILDQNLTKNIDKRISSLPQYTTLKKIRVGADKKADLDKFKRSIAKYNKKSIRKSKSKPLLKVKSYTGKQCMQNKDVNSSKKIFICDQPASLSATTATKTRRTKSVKPTKASATPKKKDLN
jgi:transcriptional regulator with AAA-type ATPase domain